MTTVAELAAGLASLRVRAGYSIRALSKATGIPSATLGGYFSGRHLPSLNQSAVLVDVLRALRVDDPGVADDWVEALARVRRESSVRRVDTATPYRGLESFTQDDAALFFGREGVVDDLAQRLDALASATDRPRLLVLVGPSGSGKSSVLRAGLVPRLRSRAEGAAVAVMVPGTEPFAALDIALSELAVAEPTSDEYGKAASQPDTEPAVLVVDQFEEVFSPDVDARQRQDLIGRLLALTGPPEAGGRSLVAVLGMRADVYAQAASDPDLLPVLQTEQALLGPMSVAELTQAVVRPAESVGVAVGADLVEVVLNDVRPRGALTGGSQSGALPLMSHALLASWSHRSGSTLSVGDYLATGGIARAVQQTAEEAFAALEPPVQVTARWLFGQLVNVDDDGVMTRRRVAHADLVQPGPEQRAATRQVIEAFVARRLLTATDATVELSHEALLDAWPRLREWVAADLDSLRLHRRIVDATMLWLEHDRDPSALLRGAPLALVEETLGDDASPGGLFTQQERAFVDASLAEENRVRDAERRRTHRLRQLLAVTTVLAVVAGLVSVYALAARNQAREQSDLAARARDEALSREMAITADRLRESDPALAAQLSLAAYQVSPTSQARSSLLDSTATPTPTRFVGPNGTMNAVASPDGTALAVAGVDGVVRLWAYDDGARQYRSAGELTADAEGQPLYTAAWSPDGRLLAVGGVSPQVTVWDLTELADPRLVTTLAQPKTAVQGLAWSPDGRSLAAATGDPSVHRWAVSGDTFTTLPAITGFDGTVQSVAFRPTGNVLATASWDGMVRLFAAGPKGPSRLLAALPVGPSTNYMFSVAFSPDGALLAAGGKDSSVWLWDTTDPAAPTSAGDPLSGPDSWVNGVAFSPDGTLLAAAASDGLAHVWRVGETVEAMGFPTPANATSVQFVDDGASLLTSEIDGVARLWPVPGPVAGGFTDSLWALGFSTDGALVNAAAGSGDGATHLLDVSDPARPTPHGPPLRAPTPAGVNDGAAAFAPDASWVAAGTATGGLAIWPLDADGRAGSPATPPAATQLVEAMAASADSQRLALVADDGAAIVWDVPHGKPTELARVTVPALPLSVALSPDGSLLAVGAADNHVYLWQLGDEGAAKLPRLTGFENYVYALAFAPTRGLLAGGSTDKTVRVWDVSDPERVTPVGAPVRGPGDTVYALAWSPAGDRLVGGSTDGTVWLWDMAAPAAPLALGKLSAYGSDVFTVAYAPDGMRVAAGGTAQDVRFWLVDAEAAAAEVCRTAGSSISQEEWARLVPGQGYRPPCD